MKNRVVYIIVLFLVFSACSRKPFSVLGKQDMEDVMVDLYISEAIYNSTYGGFKTEEEQKSLTNSVLEKHDITRAKFDSSLVWYSDNLDELNKINEAVGKRLTKMDTIYQQQAPKKINYRFSNFSNVIFPPSFKLNTLLPSFAFRIDSAKLYVSNEPKDMKFSFNVIGLRDNQMLESRLYYQYRDTLIMMKDSLKNNDNYKIKYIVDTVGRGHIKSINGYLHLIDDTNHIADPTSVILTDIDLTIHGN